MIQIKGKGGKTRLIKLAKAGTADITGCHKDGRFIAIECKVGKNKPTELQKNYLNEIASRGNAISLVAWGLQDVIDFGL